MPVVKVVGSVLPRKTSIVASGADGVVADYGVNAGEYVEEGTILSELRMTTTDLGIKEAEALLKEKKSTLQALVNGSREEDIQEAFAKLKPGQCTENLC